MKRLMLLTAAFALSASMAMALTADELVAAYQAQGFTKIEVTTGLTQIKIEAVKGKTKLEVIYDSTSGTILKQDHGWAGRPDRTPGVELSTSTHDFVGGSRDSDDDHDQGTGNDDGPGHDQNDDHGGHGSDDGPDHDAGDDHGGGRDNSGHDNSGNDNSDSGHGHGQDHGGKDD